MGKRASVLADRIEQGANALVSFAESLSDEEWQSIVPGDERSIGVLVHHVASVYPLEVQLTRGLAMGKPMVGVTWDGVAEMNAGHARDNAGASKTDTLELLRQNSKQAADAIRALNDDELDNAATVSLYGDATLTAQFFIEDHALRHSMHHLAGIKALLQR
jgi:hypothetical protein